MLAGVRAFCQRLVVRLDSRRLPQYDDDRHDRREDQQVQDAELQPPADAMLRHRLAYGSREIVRFFRSARLYPLRQYGLLES
jgi:hypothetical protein